MSQLQRLEKAFTEGRARPASATYASSGRQYEGLLGAALRDRLRPDELSFLDSCRLWIGDALNAARRDHLEQADQGFSGVRDRLAFEPLSAEARLMVQVFLEPAEAYLAYKVRDYRRAREFLLHASSLDQRLACEHGLPLMSAHRLQLGLNLVRVHAHDGESGQAVDLIGGFLDYLEHGDDRLPESIACGRALLACVPDGILRYYFDKFCAELALLMAGRNDHGTGGLFRTVAGHADLPGCQESGFGAHGHAWLRWKHVLLRGELDAHPLMAVDLLRRGRTSEPLLWFATVMEIVRLCRALGPEGSRLADWMVSEASELDQAPGELRHLSAA